MLLSTSALLAALAAAVSAVKDGRTFAVVHHYGNGPLVTARVDPIISPGNVSSHLHTVMGGSNFGMTVTGDELRQSRCTTVLVKEDMSNYWFPSLFFQDPVDGHFEPVELFYTQQYYFFEATNDDIKAFPLGLRMVSGNAMTRDPPNKDGTQNLDPSKGPVNPLQWTCPRTNYAIPSYPPDSDGTKAGIVDPNNKGSGIGFPFMKCDASGAPLRMDLHFPSCYNPAAGLEDYKTNTVFPSDAGDGKHDCPPGWIHLPHMFFEVYWNTPKFDSRWTDNSGKQPFVLANGDLTGYSGHGDFISGWNEQTLQQMIDNCDAGDAGADKCPGLLSALNDPSTSCNIPSPVNEVVTGILDKLPGINPVSGWGRGTPPVVSPPAADPAPSSAAGSASASAPAASNPPPQASSSPSSSDPATKVADPNPSATPPPATEAGGSGQKHSTSTVYETVTDWLTTTVTMDDGPAPTTPPVGDQSTSSATSGSAGFKYAGCFKDDAGRALDGDIRPNLGKMTNTLCIQHCSGEGFKLAGTEYGGQCYCGNELSGSAKLADASCDTACEGDASQTCGGGWALSVFSADGSTNLTRRAVPNRRGQNHHHLHLHRRGPSARRR